MEKPVVKSAMYRDDIQYWIPLRLRCENVIPPHETANGRLYEDGWRVSGRAPHAGVSEYIGDKPTVGRVNDHLCCSSYHPGCYRFSKQILLGINTVAFSAAIYLGMLDLYALPQSLISQRKGCANS